MTPLAVRARILALLRESAPADPASPSGKAVASFLSRMPRPCCATPGCAGKLSRNTGRCARCGGVKVVDRYTRADGTHFDKEREREDGREQSRTDIQPGTSVVAESHFVVEKMPARRCNAVLSHPQDGARPVGRSSERRDGRGESDAVQPECHATATDQRATDPESPSANP